MTLSSDYPTLLIIRGLPGSGKTFLAAELRRRLNDVPMTVLDPDATDYTSEDYLAHVERQIAEEVDPKLFAYRYLRLGAHRAIEARQLVIWNQPFTNLEIFNKMIANLQTHAEEHGTQLRILVVEMEVDPAIAKERVSERKQHGGHGPSDGRFNRFQDEYFSFAPYGYRTVTVNGADDVAVSATKVLDELKDIVA